MKCLQQELKLRGHESKREAPVTINYRGLSFDENLRIDLLVDDCLVVEAKAVEVSNPMLFKMQALSYMKLMNLPLGLAINFGGQTFKGKNIWRVILKGADLQTEMMNCAHKFVATLACLLLRIGPQGRAMREANAPNCVGQSPIAF